MNWDRIPREGVIDDGKTKYKLIRCVGQGGSSLIYEAKAIDSNGKEYINSYLVKELYPCTKHNLFLRDKNTGKIYAENETANQMLEQYKRRMKTEAERVAFISENMDAYVQPLVEKEGIFIDKNSQNRYIIYHKKAGMTLLEFLDSKEFMDLSYPERCRLFILPFLIQLYEALKTLHSKGYCHGDIAPDNLFINNKGQIEGVSKDLFLIDFNSCFLIENPPKDWIYSYKEGFSPVELCNYDGRKLESSVDTYSFVAVFFYMLTKKVPRISIWRELAKIEKNFSSPVFEQIRKIFQIGLRQNPKNRYQDCSETGQLLQDLKELEHRLNLRGGVTKAYLWEKVEIAHEEEDWDYDPILLPPTEEEIQLLSIIQRDEQEHMEIIGPAGIGKSSFIKAYLRKYRSYYSDHTSCRVPFIIRLNQYNRYKKEDFEEKNNKRQNRGIQQEFLILLDLIIQTYELKKEDESNDQSIKEGLLREFCKKTRDMKREYIIVLEDFHSIDPIIKEFVQMEIEYVIDHFHNVSLIITERDRKKIFPKINQVFHFQMLSIDQVLNYITTIWKQKKNSIEMECDVLKELRSAHIQQFLKTPQFIVLYASYLKNQTESWNEKTFPNTASQIFLDYFFGDVRIQLNRREKDGSFASDSSGIRMAGGKKFSYKFMTMIVRLLAPVLAFEMEKMPQKALTFMQIREIIQKFLPLFSMDGKVGIYQQGIWRDYLYSIDDEIGWQYNNIWREFREQWKEAFSEMEEEYYEDDLMIIFVDCIKLLKKESNQYCFSHDSYQEFFCAYYYYQKLCYWEKMGKCILEEDWDVSLSDNITKYLGELLLSNPKWETVYQTCNKSAICVILAKACYYNSKDPSKKWTEEEGWMKGERKWKRESSTWIEEERKWVEKQKDLGDPYAYYFLALLEKWAGDKAKKEKNENEEKRRQETEVIFMRQAADNSIKEAYYNMGIYYQEGKEVAVNYELAREYFYRAMEAGMDLAIVRLAGILEQKLNDPLGAVYYYLKGAEKHLSQAYTSLARLVEGKNIISGNSKLQEEYLKQAAMQLNIRSICDLGDFYLKKKEKEKAVQWYWIGVLLSNNRAICSYAICLENGIGLEKNEEDAWNYYEKAERTGRENSLNLKLTLCKVICYVWGKGIQKNIERAKQLLKEGLAFLEEKEKKGILPRREEQLKQLFRQLLKQIEQNNVLIKRNYIELEDYMQAIRQEELKEGK